jgi:hypothetical protein
VADQRLALAGRKLVGPMARRRSEPLRNPLALDRHEARTETTLALAVLCDALL